MPTQNPAPKNRCKRTGGCESRRTARAVALAVALYFGARLFWVAHPLFLTAFLGVLFGLAVASGADRLERYHIRRGVGAPLIVVLLIAALVGFGAAVAPTLRTQGHELQRKLPESIDRIDQWLNAKQNGPLAMAIRGKTSADSTTAALDSVRSDAAPGVSDSTTSLRGRL